MKNKAVFKKGIIALSIVIIFIGAWYLMGKYYIPPIELHDGTALTDEQTTSIISVEQGFYNQHLPIFARKITVLQSNEDSILWRVDYFPFGYIERSLNKEPDGVWMYNLEKRLSGLS